MQLVMNNFSSSSADATSKVPKHLESLTTSVFQSLFPPINPQRTPLKSIRRVLLLNREQSEDDDGSFVLSFRQYAISTKTTGISRPLKRLNAAEKLIATHKAGGKRGGLPNLGKLQDIADYMIGGDDGTGYVTDGGTSGSEAETDAEVEVLETATRKVRSAKARAAAAAAPHEGSRPAGGDQETVEKRAVKLVELGPRMILRMTKVEEGLCSGKIMWHEYIHKTKEEIKALEKKWEERTKEKEARRKQQRENVEKKRKAKGEKGGDADGDEADEMGLDDMDSDGYDYEDEDGAAIDSDGLQGDAEALANERMEQDGEWEDEEDEIAGG